MEFVPDQDFTMLVNTKNDAREKAYKEFEKELCPQAKRGQPPVHKVWINVLHASAFCINCRKTIAAPSSVMENI